MVCVKWEYVNMDESPQPEFLLIHQVLMKLHHCKNWLWTETVHYSTKAVFIPPSYGQCADTTLSGLLLAETVGSAQGGDEYSFLYSLTTAAVTKLLSLHKLPSHLRTWSIFQTLVLTWSLWDFILPALGGCITFLLQYDVFFFTTAHPALPNWKTDRVGNLTDITYEVTQQRRRFHMPQTGVLGTGQSFSNTRSNSISTRN